MRAVVRPVREKAVGLAGLERAEVHFPHVFYDEQPLLVVEANELDDFVLQSGLVQVCQPL